MSEPEQLDDQGGAASDAATVEEDLVYEPTPPALRSGRKSEGPEIVIVFVAPIGTDLDPVLQAFKESLGTVAYTSGDPIRMSKLLAGSDVDEIIELARKAGRLSTESESEGLLNSEHKRLMDRGDSYRRALGDGAALAMRVIGKIRFERKQVTGAYEVERSRHAILVRTAKHPAEVRLLRSAYGDRLVVVAVASPREERRRLVLAQLSRDFPDHKQWELDGHARYLLDRDEKDADVDLGQRVRDSFALADVFLNIHPGAPVNEKVRRIVELLFGRPFHTPTRDEYGMYHAAAAAHRSSAAGRQVGAAAVDPDGELLVTGCNDVPKPGGGQYWPDDKPDYRDFVLGYDANDRMKYEIVADLLDRLQKADWLSPDRSGSAPALAREALEQEEGVRGPLSGSRVDDLLEFGRIVHAEMAVITTAARRGTPLGKAVLYTTTYPCHECARLIIAAGIRRVVFVDPYPKSQVPELFGYQVANDGEDDPGPDLIPFQPFEGIAPTVYQRLFTISGRAKRADGSYKPWQPDQASFVLLTQTFVDEVITKEGAVLNQQKEAVDALRAMAP